MVIFEFRGEAGGAFWEQNTMTVRFFVQNFLEMDLVVCKSVFVVVATFSRTVLIWCSCDNIFFGFHGCVVFIVVVGARFCCC